MFVCFWGWGRESVREREREKECGLHDMNPLAARLYVERDSGTRRHLPGLDRWQLSIFSLSLSLQL